MTKSTITRERAQQIFLGNGPEPSASEERELARMALAAMDSEPVAWMHNNNNIGIPAITTSQKIGKYWMSEFKDVQPLYRHAHPAPVVPNGLRLALSNAGIAAPESDEMLAATCEKHIQALVTWVRDRKPFQSAPVVMDDRKLRSLFDSWFASDCSFDLSPEASEEDNIAWRESYWYVWQRCRAAMLQDGTLTNEGTSLQDNHSVDDTEKVNSPVIPDGYVMVPKEPTKEMLDEFDSIIDYGAEDSQDAWRRLLAAAPQSPGSEPATVPGKWIPVSERIPIPGVDVLVAKEFFGPGDWRRKVGHVRHEDSGWNIYGASWEPTHWMPLPAAPQEGK